MLLIKADFIENFQKRLMLKIAHNSKPSGINLGTQHGNL